MTATTAVQRKPPAGAGLLILLKPYRWLIAALVILTVTGNGLNLAVPKIISHAIDAYTQQSFVITTVILQFIVVASLVFALTYMQSIVQTYASERVAHADHALSHGPCERSERFMRLHVMQ